MTENRSLLSENIAKYRKAAGMTQEELGRRVGVTTQAVSKWECGGMPDPGLLPGLSDALGVSIDALFGRDGQDYVDVLRLVETAIVNTPQEQRFQKIYEICWIMMRANVAHEHPYGGGAIADIFYALKFVERRSSDTEPLPHIAIHRSQRGIEEASLARDCPYYLVLPEPEQGYSSILRNEESYLELFSLLVRPNRLKVLAFLEQMRCEAFTADYTAAQLDISQAEAEEALEDLRARRFLHHIPLSTAAGLQHAYQLNEDLDLMPFFLFAGRVMPDLKSPPILMNIRKDPVLKAPIGTGNPQASWDPTGDEGFVVKL